jgi:predicted Zn-dependent protease
LRDAVRTAEKGFSYSVESPEVVPDVRHVEGTLQPKLWSDVTMALTSDARAALARQMAAAPEAGNVLSAGEIVVGAQGRAFLTTSGMFQYYPTTVVEVSTTVRDPHRSASGWAGVTDFDLARVDAQALAARALDKCQRSANPVAVEPGRYTTILEPQAVADFFSPLIADSLGRASAEAGYGPFAEAAPALNKIGERVLDRRLRVFADPMDPLGGFVPFNVEDGEPYYAVDWIRDGVLRDLSYNREYALKSLAKDRPLINSDSYRIESAGATTTIDEMIASTQRGLLVTRFSGVTIVDPQTMMLSGYTRDGLWLIENGKITKAVKNFRFAESPIFVFNNLEQSGTSVRVFDRKNAVVVPPMKVKDFNMHALADAV